MIVVGLMLFGISVGVGVYVKMQNQAKIKFKLDILNFCDYVKTQIGFAQMSLKQIVLNYASNATVELKQMLNEYAEGLGNSKEFSIYNKELTTDEVAVLQSLFNELGKSDVKRQLELCENSKKLLINGYEDYKNKKQKAGDLGLKLSVCAGLLIAILLI